MSDRNKERRQRVEELTLKQLDEVISATERDELDKLVSESDAAAARHRELIVQEATLRGERGDFDLSEPAMKRLRAVLADRVASGVMSRIKADATAAIKRIEGSWSWLGSRRFWQLSGATAALLLLVVGVHSAYLFTRHAPTQEAFVYGQPAMTPGIISAYRVFVRDGRSAEAVSGAQVKVALVRSGQQTAAWQTTASSDARGLVELRPVLAADAVEGDYTLKITARSGQGESVVTRKVVVRRSHRLYVTTDKPLYQPGQTIHIRALALATVNLKPAAGRQLLIEVKDAKGNKVLKKQLKLSDFGIASTNLQLADQVNLGQYGVTATLGDTVSERAITVKRYRLPKFRVDLKPDRSYYAPGETVRGELVARYTFGKPVARAAVELSLTHFVAHKRTIGPISGRTDAEGKLRFSLPLGDTFVGQPVAKGDAPVSLEAKVVDPAGYDVQKSFDLTVTTRPLRVELLAESGQLVTGVKNRIYVVTAYPDGRPTQAEVTLIGFDGERYGVKTSAAGLGAIEVVPSPGTIWGVDVIARDGKGVKVKDSRQLTVDGDPAALLLQTDRAIYRTGETARLTVLSPAESGRVFVDVVKDRQTILIKALDLKDRRGELELDLPADLFGTLVLHAYRIQRSGEIVADTKVVQVNRADQLQISAQLDKESYEPAQRAMLDLVVRRADGTPAQAAIGLAGVDEAVFALHDLQPGLARIYFMLQEELLKPRYEIHAAIPFSASDAVAPGQDIDPRASAALFSAAGSATRVTPTASETFAQRSERYRHEKDRHVWMLIGGLAAALGAAALLILLALLLYCCWRIAPSPFLQSYKEVPPRRRPITDVDAVQLAELGREIRWLTIWWSLSFLLPLGALGIGQVVIGGHGGLLFGLGLGSAVLLFGFARQIGCVVSLRRNPVAAAVPLLRKLVTPLPAAFLLSAASLALMIVAQERPRALPEIVALVLVLGLLGAVVLTTGLLPAAGRSLIEKTSTARLLWVATSRLLLFVIGPALLLLAPMILYTRYDMTASKAIPLASVMAQAKDAAEPARMLTSKPSDRDGQTDLKAPTRVRRHFPETLIWRPEVVTDANGRARVEIPLADSITTWRLSLSAVSGHGELGSTTKALQVFQPFFVDIDLPVILTQNDVVEVPVALYSYLDKPQTVRLQLQKQPWFTVRGSSQRTIRLGAKQVTSVHFALVAKKPGDHKLTVRAHGSELADAIQRSVRVAPDGRRVTETINEQLTSRQTTHEIVIPQQALAGASDLLLKVHPGAFSQVIEGLDNIFAMPYGCFEQTSSTTYPSVLVLDYLRRTKQIKPQIELTALKYINLGYQRLLSFEVPGGGFEWFGKAPAHNVLTAYGLMEFSDMAKVFEVDPAVIDRTRRWLLSKQDNDGAFKPSDEGIAEGAIIRYQGKLLRSTAYIAWALAESLPEGQQPSRGLVRALDYIASKIGSTDDPYTLATAANALVTAGRVEAKSVLRQLEKLSQRDKKTGSAYWSSTSQSVTYSRGPVLDIETTALAAYAMLKGGAVSTAHRALAWLISRKDPRGTWHSTQATVLALRALLAGGTGGSVKQPVKLDVALNGQTVKALRITPATSDVMHLVSLREQLRPGSNKLTVTADANAEGLAYQIVATHYLPWQAATRPTKRAGKKPLSIDLAYDTTRLRARDQLTCKVTLRYNQPGIARMIIADLGLPPGFAVQADAFEQLRQRGVIEKYALTGQQVILYLRELRSGKPVTFSYKLRAKHPVKVSTPRSRVYKYYEPEVRDETSPVKLTAI